MSASTVMNPQTLTVTELEAAGLTAENIACLERLREAYSPSREFFSDRELQQLRFLRWQVERGLVDRG